jgi:hypothetical protein
MTIGKEKITKQPYYAIIKVPIDFIFYLAYSKL